VRFSPGAIIDRLDEFPSAPEIQPESTSMFAITTHSEQDTHRFGQALANALPSRAVIALNGTLGAGKTRLVQAVAAASGVEPGTVVSPTFVLCQHYQGSHLIHHLDAYRIRDEDEWAELGTEELFQGDAWVFIEWADRFAELLPDERLEISIDVVGEQARRFAVTARGEALEKAAERLRELTAELQDEAT
jgi:tRNA threonylcarbamoyladenosine biosynthesis protein TsaE